MLLHFLMIWRRTILFPCDPDPAGRPSEAPLLPEVEALAIHFDEHVTIDITQRLHDPALCLAVNTSGQSGIVVTFDVGALRNPFNGGTENRRNNVELQYRVGNSIGTFTSLTGSIYRNNTAIQINRIYYSSDPR